MDSSTYICPKCHKSIPNSNKIMHDINCGRYSDNTNNEQKKDSQNQNNNSSNKNDNNADEIKNILGSDLFKSESSENNSDNKNKNMNINATYNYNRDNNNNNNNNYSNNNNYNNYNNNNNNSNNNSKYRCTKCNKDINIEEKDDHLFCHQLEEDEKADELAQRNEIERIRQLNNNAYNQEKKENNNNNRNNNNYNNSNNRNNNNYNNSNNRNNNNYNNRNNNNTNNQGIDSLYDEASSSSIGTNTTLMNGNGTQIKKFMDKNGNTKEIINYLTNSRVSKTVIKIKNRRGETVYEGNGNNDNNNNNNNRNNNRNNSRNNNNSNSHHGNVSRRQIGNNRFEERSTEDLPNGGRRETIRIIDGNGHVLTTVNNITNFNVNNNMGNNRNMLNFSNIFFNDDENNNSGNDYSRGNSFSEMAGIPFNPMFLGLQSLFNYNRGRNNMMNQPANFFYMDPQIFGGNSNNNQRPVSEDILDSLPEMVIDKLDKMDQTNKNCIICLEDFKQGDKAIILPCMHFFHSDCVRDWLKTQNLCPICKFELSKENIMNKYNEFSQ